MLSMKIILIFSFCVLGFIYSSKACSLENNLNKLIMCVDNYPPLQVILADGEATGENVEVAKAFIKRLGMQVTFTGDTPFKRCIHWLKIGNVDLMVGLLDSELRQKDFHMYLYDDMTVKAFFTHKNGPKIKSFKDLKGLDIALLRGVQQSKEFDQAPSGYFNKVEVGSLLAAFSMLEKGRIDAVVCTDYYGDAILKRTTAFAQTLVKSSYTMQQDTQVFIAVSKRSKVAVYHQKLEQLAKEMYDSNEFMKIILDFQYNYPQYYLE